MALVSRDPFARTELHRQTIDNRTRPRQESCKWCGQMPRRLHCYHTEHDGGRRDQHIGFFCNVGCMRSYYS